MRAWRCREAPPWSHGQLPSNAGLPAILAADVAEYSGLIGADEEGTLGRLRRFAREPA